MLYRAGEKAFLCMVFPKVSGRTSERMKKPIQKDGQICLGVIGSAVKRTDSRREAGVDRK